MTDLIELQKLFYAEKERMRTKRSTVITPSIERSTEQHYDREAIKIVKKSINGA